MPSVHAVLLAHQAAEPEHGEVGGELGACAHPSISKACPTHRLSLVPSSKQQPLYTNLCVQQLLGAPWLQPAPQSSREQSWGLSACCLTCA